MELKTKKIDTANIEIEATISKADIDEHVNRIAKELSKSINLPGFRKGKVPVKAVKLHYGSRLVEDGEAEALKEVLNRGLKELRVEQSQIITEPTFEKFEKKDDGSIEVIINVPLRPVVEVEDYHSLIPEVEIPNISDDEVEQRIREMLEAKAPFVEVTDRGIENGDNVNLDFQGFIDGEPFDGGSAGGYNLKVGQNTFIPGFEEQLLGLKKGEEKDVKVTFPENYHNKDLAGKDAVFKCKINKIEIKETPELNEESAKSLLQDDQIVEGENPIETLKKVVKKDLENEKLSEKYNSEIKPKFREALTEKFQFDLPKSVVEREIEQRINQEVQTMSEEEINELRNNPEKIEELKERHRKEAEKSVRMTFIIDVLAQKEGVSVSDEEVQQVLIYEALMTQQDYTQLIAQYEKAGLIPLIKMSILEDKVLTKILDSKLKK